MVISPLRSPSRRVWLKFTRRVRTFISFTRTVSHKASRLSYQAFRPTPHLRWNGRHRRSRPRLCVRAPTDPKSKSEPEPFAVTIPIPIAGPLATARVDPLRNRPVSQARSLTRARQRLQQASRPRRTRLQTRAWRITRRARLESQTLRLAARCCWRWPQCRVE